MQLKLEIKLSFKQKLTINYFHKVLNIYLFNIHIEWQQSTSWIIKKKFF